MTEKRKTGVSAALARSGPGDAPGEAEPLQCDLFAPPQLSERQAERRAKVEQAERKRGRPPGSGNKSTSDWNAYLERRYSSPIEGLSAISDMTPVELLISLGLFSPDPCEPDKKPEAAAIRWAFEQIKDCRKAVMPYRHAKLGPVLVDDDGEDVPVIALGVMVRPGGGQPGDGAKRVGGPVIDARPADVVREEKQRLSETQAAPSNASPSNSDANALKDKAD